MDEHIFEQTYKKDAMSTRNIKTNFAVYITNVSIFPSELHANTECIQKQH